MLSEALSLLPYTYILHEPHLGKNYFAVKPGDADILDQFGVDLYQFARNRLLIAFFLRRLRVFNFRQDFMVREFKKILLPKFFSFLDQVGVKEINHMGWQNYAAHFPDMKVVMLGRDPKDIYISFFYIFQKDSTTWQKQFTPKNISEYFNQQFQIQLAMKENTDCKLVRYEELCLEPEVIKKTKTFVESPFEGPGQIGTFISRHPTRNFEHEYHGHTLSLKSTFRWRKEKNKELLKQAFEFAEMIHEYSRFWGYK